ncbi:MAG: bifunctional shikimate kinase/3-dehydroquinate synthase [Gaiellaceae bacterium]
MGAGKTTLGAALAELLDRPFVDVDAEIEQREETSIAEIFRDSGEGRFRELEEEGIREALRSPEPAVLALGGGALGSAATRVVLRRRAFTVLVEVDPSVAWERASATGRPLAREEGQFHSLFAERLPVYEAAADARARDIDGIVLAAAGVHVGLGALDELGSLVPGDGPVALVADPRVGGIHGAAAQLALGDRLVSTHELPAGEEAKTVAALERLWSELRLDRKGTLVALGGGCTTDAAGFAAATYLRGIPWVPVPTSLVGQVDAGIGGKTALDLSGGKNLVGAFHWPARVVIDPALLETLPHVERAEGRAEVVKTGLLAGEPLWELPEPELVRRCAAVKAAYCIRDPLDRGPRAALNLGHTFAHALEAAGGYSELTHGRAVGLGLHAALRLSVEHAGLDLSALRTLEEALPLEPARVDRDRAWTALRRDKKVESGRVRLVLLEAPGRPLTGVELPEDAVRAALDGLIAG